MEFIRRITICHFDGEDHWYWIDDRRGQYNVKNGYKMLQLNSGGASLLSEPTSIWKLRIPPKVKNFLWRICSDCLPTKLALRIRRVAVSEVCEVCRVDAEDAVHVFLKCSSAAAVWSFTPIGANSHLFNSFADFWDWIIEKPPDIVELAAMVCWSIWNNRNSVVWNNKASPVSVLLGGASAYLAAWKAAQLVPGSVGTAEGRSADVWVRPESGFLKLNVDAALFSNPNAAGFGSVVRNDVGDFVAAKIGAVPWNADPTLVEALSVREALSWIKDQRWKKVCVETDSLIFVQSLANPLEVLSPYNAIVRDCKLLLSELFNCSVRFVKRAASSVAHMLARSSSICNRQCEWFNVPPDFVLLALSVAP
ncbi:hypothetical protein OROMI_018641 [Orobanche minor]